MKDPIRFSPDDDKGSPNPPPDPPPKPSGYEVEVPAPQRTSSKHAEKPQPGNLS